ncbi:MAG: QueT transporter family protein [Defluviitaleaceae bacterium]|nr:QueT transporter family protein [Defluviitaleaceae bacterium]
MKITVKRMVIIAITAALYAAITLATIFLSFHANQFRIAESFNLLAYFNPIFAPAVALGVFLANFIGSPYGIVDALLGTTATVVALILILITRKVLKNPNIGLFVSSIWVVAINALIVPVVILLAGDGFVWYAYWPFVGSVAIGQFVVVTLAGYTVLRLVIAKHPRAVQKLKEM